MGILRSSCVTFSFLLIGFAIISAKLRYDGYQLIELRAETPKQRLFVKNLVDSDDLELDFWSEGRNVLDVLIPPQRVESFQSLIRENGLSYRVKSFNIQNDIDVEDNILKEAAEKRSGNKNRLALDYNIYNTYEDILAELDALVARCPAGLTCETVVHGVSYEGRDIKGLRVYRSNASQKKVWIDATIHAREWLATAVSLKIISNIVDDYATDPALAALVDRYDWYLLPIVNVDGYSFTWTDDRLWRKNRSPTAGAACIGTDLNRNFDDNKWGTSGSSSNACSQTFHGSAPASELETQAMQNAVRTHSADLLLTVNLHTYGRMLLTPWSYEERVGRCYVGPDDAELLAAANAAADAIEDTHNTVWTRGPFCTVLYPGSGTSVDYGKGVAGVKYTFLPELRGEHFIVPPSEIQPAYEETWNGIKAAIAHIENAGK